MPFDNSWDALLHPGRGESFFDSEPRPVFDPTPAPFRVADAWWFAELSRLIYREESDARGDHERREDLLATAGLTEERFFHRRHTQCAIVRPRGAGADRFAVLVFRGTSELRDWLTNVKATTVQWPRGGLVHRGFRRALYALWREVGDHLNRLGVPLYHTGHSLGGALATLAGSLQPPRAVYTFGSPRVGNAEFGASMAGTPVYRVVNHRDLVTTVPPSDLLGFRHVGQLCYLAGDGALHLDPSADTLAELRRAGKDAGALGADDRRWFDPVAFLADHAPINYVTRLQRLL